MTDIHSIEMQFCRVDLGPDWASTHFRDGASYGAHAHFHAEYLDLAERCGYGRSHGGAISYMHEHEVAHNFVAQELYPGESKVIRALANGGVAATLDILFEEEMAISLQAFARSGALPGSSAPGFSWFRMRDKFVALLK